MRRTDSSRAAASVSGSRPESSGLGWWGAIGALIVRIGFWGRLYYKDISPTLLGFIIRGSYGISRS